MDFRGTLIQNKWCGRGNLQHLWRELKALQALTADLQPAASGLKSNRLNAEKQKADSFSNPQSPKRGQRMTGSALQAVDVV